MKQTTIRLLSTCLPATAFSPSLLAHPGHSHAPVLLDRLLHAFIGWPAVTGLLLILLASICWSRFRGTR